MIKWIVFLLIWGCATIGVVYDQWNAPQGARLINMDSATNSASNIGNIIDEPKIKRESFSTQAPVQYVTRSTPEFSLKGLDDESYRIVPRTKGITVYHFWASWCAPCIVELPSLLKRAAQNSNSDDRFVVISIDQSQQSILRFQNRLQRSQPDLDLFPANVQWLWDPSKKVTEGQFETYRLPETFIGQDAQKTLTHHYIGDVDWHSIDFQTLRIE